VVSVTSSPSPLASSSSCQRRPYSDDEIRSRIEHCPKLASLQSINRQLAGLVNSEQSFTSQIAEIIRRDPSLTARLLRMVNSVYFGLSAKVNNIEEAVLYLGLRQIRELSMATPVIEDLEKIGQGAPALPWRDLWQHSIGTAIMTREILATTDLLIDDDTDYIIGLLHDVGKVVLATAFPTEFEKVCALTVDDTREVCEAERALIGWDHAAVGGYYLEKHRLNPELVAGVQHHLDPEAAGEHVVLAAAVQVAEQAVCEACGHRGFERVRSVRSGDWQNMPGWQLLYAGRPHEESLARASIENSLLRLPARLSGLL
jgi:HD-like signal output (HDOD) protein